MTTHQASSRRGLFVALEGIDGAGKTTAAKVATDALRADGYPTVAPDRTSVATAPGYVGDHMAALRALIWDEPLNAPYLQLGDEHWVHLQAAWYSSFARCFVTPLLEAGNVVIADTWGYKFLAKLRLRPPGVIDFSRAWAIFGALLQPDLIVRLRADPSVAAARKPAIAASETGGRGTARHLLPVAFAAYQRRVDQVLEEFAAQDGWVNLDVSALSPHEAGAALADIIRRHLATSAAPGRLPSRKVRT